MKNSYFHYNIIQQNLLRLKISIIVLLSTSYFFLFVLRRIMIYKSKTSIFSLQSNMIITSLFWKLTEVSTNNLKADIFWSVKDVQKYFNYLNLSLSTGEILCHASLEVLRIHYLN